ncbi:hypothetical protein D3C87_1247610 [compost metagenome]
MPAKYFKIAAYRVNRECRNCFSGLDRSQDSCCIWARINTAIGYPGRAQCLGNKRSRHRSNLEERKRYWAQCGQARRRFKRDPYKFFEEDRRAGKLGAASAYGQVQRSTFESTA